MEKLRYNYCVIPFLLLHQFCRVLGAEPCVRALAVYPNHLCRNALGKQIVAHHLRLIVAFRACGTADHDVLYLVLAV